MNGGIQIATLIVIAITIGVMVFTVDVMFGGGIFL